LTILQSPEKFTFVLELSKLLGYTSSVRFENVLMAGAVVSALPGFILFIWLQRFFVAGMAESALKGSDA
jgi:multiple sugar transport system permease protein